MVHVRYLLGFMLAAGMTCWCEGMSPEPKKDQPPSEASKQAIPFELKSGFLIVVEGSIGPAKGLKFILDTGTTRTIVNRSIAAKLTASSRQAHQFVNFNRTLALESVEVSDVKFGPIEVPQTTVFVGDLRKISELAVHADAIIGQDLLSLSGTMRINYPSRTIVLQARTDQGNSRNFTSVPQCYSVPATIQDVPLDLVVDTGIEGVILYEDSVARRLSQWRPMAQASEVRLGNLTLKDPKLPHVVVAGKPLQSQTLVMGKHPPGVPEHVDGFPGIAALEPRMVEFDFEKHKLRWE